MWKPVVVTIRGLLTQGNAKIGTSIHHFDIPAGSTCPGQSSLCASACYAQKGRYHFQTVKDRLAWNYEQSQRTDFVRLMIAEIKKKGVLVLRLHCAGDVYNADYARKWLEVMKQCPRVRFYLYTRSWRVAEIAPVLEQMAALRCCRLWYSIDHETGVPASIPSGVRLAYLQVDKDDEPEVLDLRFVVLGLKTHAKRVGLPMLCPQQAGKQDNCGSCGTCFR